VPGLGLHASVGDLARVLAYLSGSPGAAAALPLSAASRNAFWQVANADVALDLGFPMGLGFSLGGFGPLGLVDAGPVAVAQSGDLRFPGIVAALPRHGLGVVVLANAPEARQLVARVAGQLLGDALDAKAGIRQPPIPEVPYADPPWPRERLASFTGTWATQMGLVHVASRGDHLQVKALGKTFRLVPRTDGLLHLEYRLLGLFKINLKEVGIFGFSKTVVGGRDYLVVHQGASRLPFGVRVAPAPIPAAWEARRGRYKLENPGDEPAPFNRIHLKRQHGLLTVDLGIREMDGMVVTLVLRPDGDARAVIEGVGAGAGAVLEATDEGRTVLSGSGWRYVRVRD